MRKMSFKIPHNLPDREKLDILIPLKKTAEMLGIHFKTLLKGIKPGGKYSVIRKAKFGRSWMFERDSVLAFIYQELDAAG